jgi:hypothetical protein
MRVRVNSLYRFHPALIDRNVPCEDGSIVRVINMPGCPKANTMGHCYIEHLGGEFIQLVCCGSLQTLTSYERKSVRRVLTPTRHRRPSSHYRMTYGNGTGDDEAQRLTFA